ncbi:hypothetical protein O181_040051 [Austropuccinia psidii MF-1]|uniref:Reverse transcriptase Ty1/copia-type domain-containing protein n=1 Tax=Austropuccinia psidii MF-1 TaxID=1389203 RepID=A0A9Q3HD17_9BASI|nr:hypothetical protein [Austropuccinia psidii MF-1]
MENCKPVTTQMDPGAKLVLSNESNQDLTFSYQKAVGLLNYLTSCSRPDLAYATSILSQFLDKPLDCHVSAFRRILRYLQGTKNYELTLGGTVKNSEIIGFSDSDWGSNYDGCSFSGYGLLCGGLIIWKTKKQPIVALSTTEAELQALTEVTQDALWIKKLLFDFHLEPSIDLKCDNQGAIALCVNPLYQHRTQHINICINWIRDLINSNLVHISYIPTNLMWADLFTKGLGKLKHYYFCSSIKLLSHLSDRAC